jgi:hypothetical protein
LGKKEEIYVTAEITADRLDKGLVTRNYPNAALVAQ